LTALLYDDFVNLLILADNLGSIYFYNVSNPINPVKLQAIHSQFKAISLIKLITESKRLFIGTKSGELHIFEIDLSKEGLHMKQENSIYGDSQLSVVNVFPSKDYLIVGYSNGSIYVFTDGNDYPECNNNYIITFL
jgi:6-phosphogluconolactonase (cycloisomerase 2 family)